LAKKKNSVALFEVIQKSKRSEGGVSVPGWMEGEGPGAPAPASPAAETGSAPAPASPRASEPLISVAGDRLRVSMTYRTGALAATGLVILLVAGFSLGWWGGAASVTPQAPALGNGKPMGKHVLAGPNAKGVQPKPKPVAPGQRQPGKWYLVIQSMTGVEQQHLADAGQIVAFCKAQGHGATVARYNPRSGKQRYIVWSLKPFDKAGSAEAQAYARQIEELGKKYRQAGGKYNFQQRTSPSAKFDPWFEPYR
jgi:hypothetical protein